MNRKNVPDSLYLQCMDYCIARIEARKGNPREVEGWKTINRLGVSVAEDFLSRAFHLANKNKSRPVTWKEEWQIFLTSKISRAILLWDEEMIAHVRNRCKELRRVRAVRAKRFYPGLILECPEPITILDFDGELINRGKTDFDKVLCDGFNESWLCESENIFRYIFMSNAKIPDYALSCDQRSLTELHLGNVTVRVEDLEKIVQEFRNLRLLKHYQLVSALYKLHSEAWRRKENLPVYKLTNLDVDFSHVVRCRMSPEWVLAPDALHLAVKLCPRTKYVRVRFDCNTPNDVILPLLQLESIREFSAVCVTSGERSLVDFSDIAPILEKYGSDHLTYLELKVIEEVEIHIITEYCKKLDTLVLSGCGYVTPATCSSHKCHSSRPGSLKKLRLLFYADGDDFSWDHGIPECFWKAALLSCGMNQIVSLRGIFLEYPRISSALASSIFSRGKKKLPFPNLVALSLCRFEEITIEHIASVCGISDGATIERVPSSTLKYVRLSECEKINETQGNKLKKWVKDSPLKELRLHIDRAKEGQHPAAGLQ